MAMASVSSHHCCASTTLSFCPRSGTTAVSFSSPSSSCPSSSASSSSSSLRLRSLLPGKRICESHTNASYPKSALVSPDVEKLLSSSSRRSERLSGARSHLTRPRRCAVFCNASQTTTPNGAVDFRRRSPKEINVLIVGATGYIGKFVVREVVKRGYNVIAVAREKSGIGGKSGVEQTQNELAGAQVCFADVTNLSSLQDALRAAGTNIDVVISCLASRRGGVKDSWVVDYGATKNSLVAGRELGASHFVLLSAICVQKPLLEFQRAKLKFEEELQSESNDSFTYSVVRPTAFFKSLGGQVKSVQGGGPYVMFGDGALNACKPISEADLARFVADSITDEDKVNKVLPIGGPGKALTPLEQGSILFRVLGKEPKFIKVPIQIMDFVISQLDFWKRFFPKLEDVAEFGKIGRYYAAESMLVLNPETGKYDADATPSYGSDTLEAFFENVAKYGMAGQELGDQAVF